MKPISVFFSQRFCPVIKSRAKTIPSRSPMYTTASTIAAVPSNAPFSTSNVQSKSSWEGSSLRATPREEGSPRKTGQLPLNSADVSSSAGETAGAANSRLVNVRSLIEKQTSKSRSAHPKNIAMPTIVHRGCMSSSRFVSVSTLPIRCHLIIPSVPFRSPCDRDRRLSKRRKNRFPNCTVARATSRENN